MQAAPPPNTKTTAKKDKSDSILLVKDVLFAVFLPAGFVFGVGEIDFQVGLVFVVGEIDLFVGTIRLIGEIPDTLIVGGTILTVGAIYDEVSHIFILHDKDLEISLIRIISSIYLLRECATGKAERGK